MKLVLCFCRISLAIVCNFAPAMADDDRFAQLPNLPNDCVEPLKPLALPSVEEIAPEQIRQDFKLYFDDVEIYLNCLNKEAYRVRVEAKRAAYEMKYVLNLNTNKYTTPNVVERPPMIVSGHLNLNHKGVGD